MNWAELGYELGRVMAAVWLLFTLRCLPGLCRERYSRRVVCSPIMEYICSRGLKVFKRGKVAHIALYAEAYEAVLVYTWIYLYSFNHRLYVLF